MSPPTLSNIYPNNSTSNASIDKLNVNASNLLEDEYNTSVPNTLLQESKVSTDLLIVVNHLNGFSEGFVNEELHEDTLPVDSSSIASKRKKNIFTRFCNFVSKKLERIKIIHNNICYYFEIVYKLIFRISSTFDTYLHVFQF